MFPVSMARICSRVRLPIKATMHCVETYLKCHLLKGLTELPRQLGIKTKDALDRAQNCIMATNFRKLFDIRSLADHWRVTELILDAVSPLFCGFSLWNGGIHGYFLGKWLGWKQILCDKFASAFHLSEILESSP